MPIFRRDRFGDVVERQLDLFRRENAELLRDVDAAFDAYDAAGAGEAEARYETYLDLVETAADELVALREAYAATLADEDTAADYERYFNARVRKTLPRYGLELD